MASDHPKQVCDQLQYLENQIGVLFEGLATALKEEYSDEMVLHLGHDIINAVDAYFKQQEDAMAHYNFPDSTRHIVSHSELMNDVLVLCKRIVVEDRELAQPTLHFLTRLFDAHVNVQDVELMNYLCQNGES